MRVTEKQATAGMSLDQALAFFGYSDAVPSHERYTLLSAVMLFASSNGRPDVEARCEAMMAAIREENVNG